MVYIYALIDPRTALVRYVGQTTNLKERYYQHCSSTTLRKTYVGCWLKSLWVLDIKPILEVLSVETEETWRRGEQFWILYFRRLGYPLTNLTDGGDGSRGITRTPETREKIRQANLGRKHSIFTREKMRQSNRGKSTAEMIAKLRRANIGRVWSKEDRRTLSIAHIGKHPSLETRRKMSLAHLGVPLSSETRKHMSEAIRGSWKIRKDKQLNQLRDKEKLQCQKQ